MSRRAISGGFDNRPPAPRGIYAPRDSILLPPSRPVFEPREFSQAQIYKIKMVERLLLGVAVALFVGVFILLFVKT